MCTLVAAFRCRRDRALVVAANRDERLGRPATPPALWPGEPFVAPRDEVAGGTWLGVTKGGLFVGITNRFGAPNDPARASRGHLVVEALRAPSAVALHASLASTPASRFNAFHLLYADRTHAFVTWSNGDRVTQETLEPGLHIVTERSLGGDDRGRTELIRSRISPESSLEDLEELMRQHRPVPFEGLCVHVPEFDYGTRSSMILSLGESLASSTLRWAEGAPCSVPYEDRSSLLRDLAAS